VIEPLDHEDARKLISPGRGIEFWPNQCIRDVAASRDLSDEEIKPALTLKHQEIARFSEQHGVNIGWLLEGRGRVFMKDPITVNPNMTGSEFAAVVRTLPAAEQRLIEARLREMLRQRSIEERMEGA
jgi:hypothetical protein